MKILGLLDIYFDAVVVYFYSDWLWPYCGDQNFYYILKVVQLMWYSNRNTILQILPTYKHFNVGVKEKDMIRRLNLKKVENKLLIYRDEAVCSYNSLIISSEFNFEILIFLTRENRWLWISLKVLLPSAPQTKFLLERLDEH